MHELTPQTTALIMRILATIGAMTVFGALGAGGAGLVAWLRVLAIRRDRRRNEAEIRRYAAAEAERQDWRDGA